MNMLEIAISLQNLKIPSFTLKTHHAERFKYQYLMTEIS